MNRRYLAAKVGQAFVTILAILVINFALFRILPGDPVRTLLPRRVPIEAVEATRAKLGLDQPLVPNQFVTYLLATIQGEFGISFRDRIAVAEVVGQKIGPTVLLVGTAQILAIVLGLLIGIYAGWRRGRMFDRLSIGASLALYSAPVFWLGMLAIIGARTFVPGVFPVSGGVITPGASYPDLLAHVGDIAIHLALPASVLAVALIAQYALIMRSSLVEVLAEDYVTTARAKGLREGQVLRRHALPNALLPTVTVIAINLGFVLAGAITLEVVFNWPGLGALTLVAVEARDYPVLQGIFLLVGVSVVLANLAADLLYGLLDPRVRG